MISFPPSPAYVALLEERLSDRGGGESWEIVPVGLSDEDGEAWLSVGGGATAPDNRLAGPDEPSTEPVRAAQGGTVFAAGYKTSAPVKVDVEGFDREVLDSMGFALGLPSLRAICVETIFGMLNERAKLHDPTRIIRLLKAHAFTVKWVDRSPFVAQR
jgi:FkbM family methyltransferase